MTSLRYILFILVCQVLVGTHAQASIVTYTGNAFTNTGAGAGNLTAVFEFSTPLTNGATLTPVDISSWSMSGAGVTITSDTSSFFTASFDIGADLLPSSWFFAAEAGPAVYPDQLLSLFNTTGADVLTLSDMDVGSAGNTSSTGQESRVVNNPGDFAFGTTTAVPEPSAFHCWILLGLLVVIRRKVTQFFGGS